MESLKEEDEFLNNLPVNLKEELLAFIFSSLVKDIKFLQNRVIEFQALVYPQIRSVTKGPNQIVYFEGDHPNDIFFIKKGAV